MSTAGEGGRTQTIVIVPPAPILGAAVVRERLGLSSKTSDASIEAFIAAATATLDGPDGWLGRALGRQTLERQSEAFPYGRHEVWRDRAYSVSPAFTLLSPPIISIDSVTYLDDEGADQLVDPAAYVLSGRRLSPAGDQSWPSSRYASAAVRVRYVAGYADGDVPPPIVQAIILQVASLNAMTKADPLLASETIVGVFSRSWSSADIGSAYDKAASALLAPYRVFD